LLPKFVRQVLLVFCLDLIKRSVKEKENRENGIIDHFI